MRTHGSLLIALSLLAWALVLATVGWIHSAGWVAFLGMVALLAHGCASVARRREQA